MSTSRGSISIWLAVSMSASDMPMPVSSMLTTHDDHELGDTWLRTRTSEPGGEKVVAFSMSSASRWARSATARPVTSTWSLTSTSTRP